MLWLLIHLVHSGQYFVLMLLTVPGLDHRRSAVGVHRPIAHVTLFGLICPEQMSTPTPQGIGQG